MMPWKTCLVFLSSYLLTCHVAVAQPASKPALRGKVLVLAAASTTEVIEEIRDAFVRLHPEVMLGLSFAGSSTLARQIEAGAGADVFLSASREWADVLERENLVARRRDLLGNRLVVIVPVGSKLKIDDPAGLAQASIRRLALADPRAVPAGIYAREALEKLHLWDKLRGRVAGAADVRQAMRFVETGAADAGIVYATDAAVDQKVRVVLRLDVKLSEPIRYRVVLLKRGAKNRAAEAFYDFLASTVAADVFTRYGFEVLAKTGPHKTDEEVPCGR